MIEFPDLTPIVRECLRDRDEALGRIFRFPDCCIDFYVEHQVEVFVDPWAWARKGGMRGLLRTEDERRWIRQDLIAIGRVDMADEISDYPRWKPCPRCAADPPEGCVFEPFGT